MSDQESEVNPAGPDGDASLNGSFSSNGYDPGAVATADERAFGGASFLADLARAMQATAVAEAAHDAEETDQRRQTHVDAIRAREAIEAEDLRELAKEDVKGIDAWSDGEIKRIKLERERRIAARREQLQIRLEEHRVVVSREIDAVEAAVAAYRSETESFFARLGSQTDPVEIARQAGTRPPFPVLDQIGPDDTPSSASFQAAAPAPTYAAAAAAVAETAVEPPLAETAHDAGQDTPVEQAADTPVEQSVDTPVEQPDDPNHLIGVMDPDISEQASTPPWELPAATDEAAETPAAVVAAADGDAASGSPDAETVIAQQEGSPDQDGADEPVSVSAESRVVMPRSSGAGSWLRWPNTVDHSDPSH